MTFEGDIDGRRRRLELEQGPDGWIATIDGTRIAVDAVQIGETWSLLVRSGQSRSAGRTSYQLVVAPGAGGVTTVYVDGHAIEVRAVDPRAHVRRGREQSDGKGGRRQVTAPMPGRIAKVLVKPGDRVNARQGLVVVEAMKMENELRAPADAVVREVPATEGTSVDAGTVLVILE